MAIAYGRLVHPPFRERLISDAQTHAWDDLGPRQPVGVCFHTMVGTLWGTDGYFRSGAPALTDYGIGGSTDGPHWDGVILRWNDPRGRRSGWANGGVDGLEGDGPLFVRTLGVSAINRDLVSIERSDGGDITTPMSPKQFESTLPADRLLVRSGEGAVGSASRSIRNVGIGIVTHLLPPRVRDQGLPVGGGRRSDRRDPGPDPRRS